MQFKVYYMFVPTSALTDAAREAGEKWLLDPQVWIDEENDRTGRKHSPQKIEQAFWDVFQANLVSEPPEPDLAKRFRKKCLQLGFSGCWNVHVSRQGDSVEELLSEARDAAPFTERAQSE